MRCVYRLPFLPHRDGTHDDGGHNGAGLSGAHDVVGNWSAQQGCEGKGDFAYIRTGLDVQQVVTDGQREYRTPVRIKADGGFVRIHIDEKVYTFRLPSPDRLEAL